MQLAQRQTILETCNARIAEKGAGVAVSFYAFCPNRNDDPDALMKLAEWWIKTHRLDHFEKAVKIRALVQDEQ